jgi:hypothetical protein
MAIVQAQTVNGMQCVMDIARVVAGRVARTEWVGTQGQIAADWFHHRVSGVMGNTAPFEWAVQPQQTILATLRAFVHAIETNSQNSAERPSASRLSASGMLKKSASGVLSSSKSSTYPRGYASGFDSPAALLDSLFEHPAMILCCYS